MSHPIGDNSPNDPQQPNQYQNPNQYQQPQFNQQPPKKKGGCLKWGAIIVGALIVLGIISSLFGGDKSDNDSDSSSAGQSAEQTAKKDEAKKDSNTPLAVGETFKGKKGLEVTVNSFDSASSFSGKDNACAAVTYKNAGDKQVDFKGYWDWKAQNPAGVITNPTFTGDNDLNSGSLAPGGTVSGNVCFEGAAPGNYVLNFAPGLSLSTDKASWNATL